jgi:DNA anti-recombination protein RmuC
MTDLSLLAQAANAADPNAIGVSITSLIGSLGAAGAAVAVTYYFLGFLKSEGEKQNRVFQEFRDYHAESQRKFQEQLDRLTDRQEQLQRAFQDQVSRMTEAQNALLRDAVLGMKSVEKTLEGSTTVIHGLEKTVAALQVSVNTIDLILRRPGDERSPNKPPSRSSLKENVS